VIARCCACGVRFGRKGVAINFLTTEDVRTLREIEQFYNTQIDEMPMNVQASAVYGRPPFSSRLTPHSPPLDIPTARFPLPPFPPKMLSAPVSLTTASARIKSTRNARSWAHPCVHFCAYCRAHCHVIFYAPCHSQVADLI